MSAPQPSAAFVNGPVCQAFRDSEFSCWFDEIVGIEDGCALLAAVEDAVKAEIALAVARARHHVADGAAARRAEIDGAVQQALADHHCARCDGTGECRRDEDRP